MTQKAACTCFLFLLFSAQFCIASAPKEFADIPWKATLTEAKRILLQRPGVRLTQESPQRLVFEGGELADQPVQRWELDFVQGELRVGTAYFVVTGSEGATREARREPYEALYDALCEKYGKVRAIKADRHATCDWAWKVDNARTGDPEHIAVFLDLGWKPPQLKLRYSFEPVLPNESLPAPHTDKRKDL